MLIPYNKRFFIIEIVKFKVQRNGVGIILQFGFLPIEVLVKPVTTRTESNRSLRQEDIY